MIEMIDNTLRSELKTAYIFNNSLDENVLFHYKNTVKLFSNDIKTFVRFLANQFTYESSFFSKLKFLASKILVEDQNGKIHCLKNRFGCKEAIRDDERYFSESIYEMRNVISGNDMKKTTYDLYEFYDLLRNESSCLKLPPPLI